MSLAMWFDLGSDASLVVEVVTVRVVTAAQYYTVKYSVTCARARGVPTKHIVGGKTKGLQMLRMQY